MDHSAKYHNCLHIAVSDVSTSLSDVQQSYCVSRISKKEEKEAACNVLYELQVVRVDAETVESLWDKTIVHFDILRSFVSVEGNQKYGTYSGGYKINRRSMGGAEQDQLINLKQTLINKPFKLDCWPAFSVTIVELPDDTAIVYLVFDMLIADVNSLQTVIDHFITLLSGEEPREKSLINKYVEYKQQLAQVVDVEYRRQATAYWDELIASLPPSPHLNKNLSAQRIAESDVSCFIENWHLLKEIAKQHAVSPDAVLLTLYSQLFVHAEQGHSLSVVIVEFNSQWRLAKTEQIVGDFTSVSWLAGRVSSSSFAELAKQVDEQLKNDRQYALHSGLRSMRKRQLGAKAIEAAFPVVYTTILRSIENDKSGAIRFNGVKTITPDVDIDCISYEQNGGLILQWDVKEGVSHKLPIKTLFSLYERAINALCSGGSIWGLQFTKLIQQISASEYEMNMIIPKDNNTSIASGAVQVYAQPSTIHALFDKAAEQFADRNAIVFEGQFIDYQSLRDNVDAIALYIQKKGIKKDQVIAVLLDRSVEMVSALLGVMKSGAAYLPLDTSYPKDRIKYIIDESEAPYVITTSSLAQRCSLGNIGVEWLDIYRLLDKEGHSREVLAKEISDESDLAYVIYTSGSTGYPKGCMIEHKSVVNRLLWMAEKYHIDKSDFILQKTPYTFDVSVWELFLPLIVGATMVLAKPKGHHDISYLTQLIKIQKVTICHFVPSVLSYFLREGAAKECVSLRHVMASGEVLPYSVVENFLNTLGAELHNLYGPTEAAIDVTYWHCQANPQSKVYIGRPVSNTHLYVLNDRMEPVTRGMEGELYIGGVQVGRGYLKHPELTEKAFIKDPFNGDGKAIMYKTGDHVRMSADGLIDYVGRKDSQVKVRGLRIEIGEIENSILLHPDISETAVVVQDIDSVDPKLVAYICSSNDQITLAQIRSLLKSRLPEYMLPNAVVLMNKLPITPHGKLDRKNLPWGNVTVETEAQISTADKLYIDLECFIKNALNIDSEIASDQDLFDLGVTSFTLMQIVGFLKKKYKVSYPVEVLLNAPTLDRICAYISTITNTGVQAEKSNQEQVDKAEIYEFIKDFIAEKCQVKIKDINTDIFDIGFTSFTLMQLVKEINDNYCVIVPVETILGSSEISSIVEYVAGQVEFGVVAEPDVVVGACRLEAQLQVNDESSISRVQHSEICENLLSYAESLGFHDITVDDDVFDAGFTSFTLMQVTASISKNYNVNVPVDYFLESPTIKSIADYVMGQVQADSSSVVQIAQKNKVQKDGFCSDQFDLKYYPHEAQRYWSSGPALMPSFKSVGYEQFCRLLSVLAQYTVDNQVKYLHPSGGGKYPVQTYVTISSDGVNGVDPGAYYYDPRTQRLWKVSDANKLEASALNPKYLDIYNNASFTINLVAQMDAIVPFYADLSQTLVELDIGYISNLLQRQQAATGLDMVPVLDVDGESLDKTFKLDSGHQYLMTFCVGTGLLHASFPGLLIDLSENLSEHFKNVPHYRSFYEMDQIDRHPTLSTYTKEQLAEVTREERHIRKFDCSVPYVDLKFYPAKPQDYLLRSSQRKYSQNIVPYASIEKMFSLLSNQRGHNLYWSQLGYAADIYLYIKPGRVEGLMSGIYKYDRDHHSLHMVNNQAEKLDDLIKSCHLPFNRNHYKSSAFNIFIVAGEERTTRNYGSYGIRLANYEAGQIGQLLMDYQSEMNLGFCAIGALQFHKVSEYFEFNEKCILLHSLVGGRLEHQETLSSPIFVSSSDRQTEHRITNKPLAIVGISGRYPDSDDVNELWSLVSQGRSAITSAPDRCLGSGEKQRWGAFINDVDNFDSLFFRISPSEAKLVDPQERKFLEVVWLCLENAGYTKESLKLSTDRVGVFIGCMWSDYNYVASGVGSDAKTAQSVSLHSSIANRVSHFFDFSGPSIAIDTSCASALTALHLAQRSIASGECDAAIVGGINLCLSSRHFDELERLGLLSEDNQSAAFSANGTGWVIGEGVGALLLRPLESAKLSNDIIHAVIKATLVQHTGETKNFGVPDARRMEESLTQLIAEAGIKPEDINYVESAATGAPISDAVEVSALKSVIRSKEKGFQCLIGSIKPNIGHLESASFMSQISKVIEQFKHEQVAPTIMQNETSPLIDLGDSSLVLNTTLRDMSQSQFNLALINSIGAFGSIGHVLLQRYQDISVPKANDDGRICFVPISAPTDDQLTCYCKKLLFTIEVEGAEHFIRNIAYTMQTGRSEWSSRVVFIVRDIAELRATLKKFIALDGLRKSERAELVDESFENASVDEKTRSTLSAWINGGQISWEQFHKGDERRVVLPGYCFEAVRHWVTKVENSATGSEQASISHSREGYSDSVTEAKVDVDISADAGQLFRASQAYFIDLIARITEIDHNKIDPKLELSAYGFNSMLVTRMGHEVSKWCSKFNNMILYDCKNIRNLTEFCIRHYEAELRDMLGIEAAKGNNCLPKQTFVDVEYSQSTLDDQNTYSELGNSPPPMEEFAIIGISVNFPKSKNLKEFWINLCQGKDCIEEIPSERWDYQKYNQSYKWGGFIEDYDKFDPLFFGIAPAEAELMDPQERLFLQTSWSAFEDAGYKRNLGYEADKIGVFVGVMYGEYQLYGAEQTKAGIPTSLNSIYGSIANRVSYVMNFNGPSMAVDTFCSSSLTALHLACQSIIAGDCHSALVGGVNLSIHPNKYIMHERMNMPSSDGKCRAFGAGGDGFVPGEGVGAIVIKRKTDAERNGDHIYAIIKGSSINHDAKTNGYTVPSPAKQADLVKAALKNSGVKADSISYIETHGTGTALGDPIEITGLSMAFDGCRHDQSCAIGSVKSNIGHLEAAAGIASIAKVILQMKYSQLVPSLHANTLNPNINFEETPFYVQRSLSRWDRQAKTISGKKQVLPLRAGISSFGAGGSNAHVILEEYRGIPLSADNTLPFIFVLSAKNQERLKEYIQIWSEFVSEIIRKNSTDQSINEILRAAMYTLQVSREPMGYRVGFVAQDYRSLSKTLVALKEDRSTEEVSLYSSHLLAGTNDEIQWVYDGDELDIIKLLASHRRYEKLTRLWVSGLNVDWLPLYQGHRPTILSIPTYPFAKKRYWLPAVGDYSILPRSRLSPLIDETKSTLESLRYVKHLRGNEEFDERTSAAYLIEMAIASARLASDQPKFLTIERVAMATSVSNIGNQHTLVCSILPKTPDGRSALDLVLGQGDLESSKLLSADINASSLRAGPSNARKFRDSNRYWSTIDVEDSLNVSGYMVSPLVWSRAIEAVSTHSSMYWGVPGKIRYIHKVSCPIDGGKVKRIEVVESISPYFVNKGEVAFDLKFIGDNDLVVASVEGLCVSDTIETNTALSNDMIIALQPALKLSEIVTATGAEQLVNCALVYSPSSTIVKQIGSLGVIEKSAIYRLKHDKHAKKSSARLLSCDFTKPDQVSEILSGNVPKPIDALIFHVIDDGNNVSLSASMDKFRSFFNICKFLLSTEQPLRLLCVVERSSSGLGIYSALSSFLRSACKEISSLSAKLVAINASAKKMSSKGDYVGEIVAKELLSIKAGVDEIVYDQHDQRSVTVYKGLSLNNERYQFVDEGVYLITGGVGKVGLLLAKYLITRTSCHLVLVGRSELSAELKREVQRLSESALSAKYLRADVSAKGDLESVRHHVLDQYGRVTGIFHCAGLVADRLLSNKELPDLDQVCMPKVQGVVAMDQVFKDDSLDFVVYFSSLVSVMGNPGQTDYALANGFMDKFSEWRNGLVESGERYGKTLSIGWPYWENGGMSVDPIYLDMMYKDYGICPMYSPYAFDMLDQLMNIGVSSVSVVSGNLERFAREHNIVSLGAMSEGVCAQRAHPVLHKSREVVQKPKSDAEPDVGSLSDTSNTSDQRLRAISAWLLNAVSDITKIDTDEFSANNDFSSLGMDSIMIMKMVDKIFTQYKIRLYPRELEENNNVDKLSAYLMTEIKSETEIVLEPVQQQLAGIENADNDVLKNITRFTAEVLKIDELDILADSVFSDIGMDSILAMQLINKIHDKYRVRIYPRELDEYSSIGRLSDYLSAEITEMLNNPPDKAVTPSGGNVTNRSRSVTSFINSDTHQEVAYSAYESNKVIYILSTPRAGSTLLRVMMQGHKEIFSPPELHLLEFDDMEQWATQLRSRDQHYLMEGLIKTISTIDKCDIESARQRVDEMVFGKMPMRDVYSYLMAKSQGKFFVDKSPTYAFKLETLNKAEAITQDALFIHLTRHPLSVMSSLVTNRFDKLFKFEGHPWEAGATLWRDLNSNIEKFLSGVPALRRFNVRYEDLVANPETVSSDLCHWLRLPYEDDMIDPYQGDRMRDGLYANSIPIGDPQFNSHKSIDPSLALAWKKYVDYAIYLDAEGRKLADNYGYKLEI